MLKEIQTKKDKKMDRINSGEKPFKLKVTSQINNASKILGSEGKDKLAKITSSINKIANLSITPTRLNQPD